MSTSGYWNNIDLNFEPPQLKNIKHTAQDIIIVDDFFDAPDSVRGQLLQLSYEAPPNPKLGVISFNAEIPDNVMAEIEIKLKSHLGKNILFHPRSKCAATLESIPINSVCHVDGGDNMVMFNWTVVIYMNLPSQCRGGTVLYKHLPTGHTCNKYGMRAYEHDLKDESKWELIERADMKYNRALLCPAWRFHSLEYTFGDNIQNARLTVNPKVIAYG